MPSLAEIRQKYPQYQDLSDQALADGLYRKHYSDMPRAEFGRKVGLSGGGSLAAAPAARVPAIWVAWLASALRSVTLAGISQPPPAAA